MEHGERLLERARVFAEERHRGQLRAGTDRPYVTHPVDVATRLGRHYPGRFELIAAGYLHDVVEDTPTSQREIEDAFGPVVGELVAFATRMEHDTWLATRAAQIAKLAGAPPDCARLKAADALSNATDTVRDLGTTGSITWQRFGAPPADIAWYYTGLLDGVHAALGSEPIVTELAEQIALLGAGAAAHGEGAALVDRAAEFARARHAGQLRRGTSGPFIDHPAEVAGRLLHDYPAAAELAAAGWLHDVLEDTPTTASELALTFGPRVATLVEAVTRRPREPWSLEAVEDLDVVRLKAADVLSNMRALLAALETVGASAWGRYWKSPSAKLAHYRGVAEVSRRSIPHEPVTRLVHDALAELEQRFDHDLPDGRGDVVGARDSAGGAPGSVEGTS